VASLAGAFKGEHLQEHSSSCVASDNATLYAAQQAAGHAPSDLYRQQLLDM
jgi:hypothetical protein